MITKEQYMQQLLDSYDADELVDILNISAEEILERFEDKVDEKLEVDEDEEDGTGTYD